MRVPSLLVSGIAFLLVSATVLSLAAYGETPSEIAALAEATPSEFSALLSASPEVSVSSTLTATIEGPTLITAPGEYHYTVCGLGTIPPGAVASVEVYSGGVIAYGPFPQGTNCLTGSKNVGPTTGSFYVWGVIFSSIGAQLAASSPMFVHEAIPVPSVWISGDDGVAPNEECAWQAVATGGTPPYSYRWWGAFNASTATIFGSLSNSSYLWVEVTDANSLTDTDEILIDVDEMHQCDF